MKDEVLCPRIQSAREDINKHTGLHICVGFLNQMTEGKRYSNSYDREQRNILKEYWTLRVTA